MAQLFLGGYKPLKEKIKDFINIIVKKLKDVLMALLKKIINKKLEDAFKLSPGLNIKVTTVCTRDETAKLYDEYKNMSPAEFRHK